MSSNLVLMVFLFNWLSGSRCFLISRPTLLCSVICSGSVLWFFHVSRPSESRKVYWMFLPMGFASMVYPSGNGNWLGLPLLGVLFISVVASIFHPTQKNIKGNNIPPHIYLKLWIMFFGYSCPWKVLFSVLILTLAPGNSLSISLRLLTLNSSCISFCNLPKALFCPFQ